jgi:hypothetical protein
VTNRDHADSLTAEADGILARRRALLTAAVALGTTTTIPAARRVLTGWAGPPAVRAEAIAIIDALTRETP